MAVILLQVQNKIVGEPGYFHLQRDLLDKFYSPMTPMTNVL